MDSHCFCRGWWTATFCLPLGFPCIDFFGPLLSLFRVARGCTLNGASAASGSPFLVFPYSLPRRVLPFLLESARDMVISPLRSNSSHLPTAPNRTSLAGVCACVRRTSVVSATRQINVIAPSGPSPEAVTPYIVAEHLNGEATLCFVKKWALE